MMIKPRIERLAEDMLSALKLLWDERGEMKVPYAVWCDTVCSLGDPNASQIHIFTIAFETDFVEAIKHLIREQEIVIGGRDHFRTEFQVCSDMIVTPGAKSEHTILRLEFEEEY